MNEDNCRDYYVGRAETSRNFARRAANPAIAAIHAELAVHYDKLVLDAGPVENGTTAGASDRLPQSSM